nr:retrovirus-related Pol polyprotein from transposon TNT 1-94 [Tanacetum cinerariifolium]
WTAPTSEVGLPCVLGKQKKQEGMGSFSEVFNTFKMWKVAVKNETNLRVKCLKIDNGGEYSSRDFIKYYTENRIRMLKTVLETTQHNGVAERMNQTLNDRSKSMRLHGEFKNHSKPKWELRYGKESKNSKSFKDSGISYEEDLEDEASSDEGGSKTPHVPRSSKESRALDGRKRYKAQLVVNGFQQKRGVDYYEIFSPVVKMTIIRLVLSVIASGDLHLEQLDVKITILHGDLDEDIYMAQLEGFQSAGKEENLICKLKKIMYGLKQAPRQWYLKFDNFMQRAGYKRCVMDHCCYLNKVGSSFIILLLYVDDMFVI